MKAEFNLIFPCGYQISMKASAWSVEFPESLILGKCPLHGEKCNRNPILEKII